MATGEPVRGGVKPRRAGGPAAPARVRGTAPASCGGRLPAITSVEPGERSKRDGNRQRAGNQRLGGTTGARSELGQRRARHATDGPADLSWAKANRETGTLVNALAWVDEQTRASIEGLFAAAPEAVRAQYGSAGGFILSVVAEPWTRSGPMKRVPGHLRVARSRLHAGFMANTESDNLEVTRSGVRGKIHGRMNHEQPIAAVTAPPTQLVREQGPRWRGGCAGGPGEP